MTKAQKIFTQYRKKLGFTQVEYANLWKISQATVSLIEKGEANPTADIILTIQSKLNKVNQ